MCPPFCALTRVVDKQRVVNKHRGEAQIQNVLCHPPCWTMAHEAKTRELKTRRWQDAAIRTIFELSDSFSQQLW